jgi:SAM-dependent methyltransferase
MKGDTMKKTVRVLVFLSVLLSPAALYLQEWHLDVPYVPTRPEVVAKMLDMAKVGKDDILYDLGCGDGRIVITAAKLYGTHGVGIDINPERIKESQENAEKEGVTSLVKFFQQDLFETDFHEATVVSLYLLSSVNLRLRPILFSQLRPGSRVVSHDFSMDTWKPDDSAVVEEGGRTHDVFFWTIPANASGSWQWTWSEGPRSLPCRLDVEQRFQFLSGRIAVGGRELPLKGPAISGDKVKFSVDREENGRPETITFEGRVIGDTVVGTMGGQGRSRQAWKAERNRATKKPIDVDGEGNR